MEVPVRPWKGHLKLETNAINGHLVRIWVLLLLMWRKKTSFSTKNHLLVVSNFCFSPWTLGKMIQSDKYVFRWVGSTTNKRKSYLGLRGTYWSSKLTLVGPNFSRHVSTSCEFVERLLRRFHPLIGFSDAAWDVWNATYTRWWFQIFLIFIPTWGNDQNWLEFDQLNLSCRCQRTLRPSPPASHPISFTWAGSCWVG